MCECGPVIHSIQLASYYLLFDEAWKDVEFIKYRIKASIHGISSKHTGWATRTHPKENSSDPISCWILWWTLNTHVWDTNKWPSQQAIWPQCHQSHYIKVSSSSAFCGLHFYLGLTFVFSCEHRLLYYVYTMYIIYKKVLIYYLFPPVYIWFPQYKACLI